MSEKSFAIALAQRVQLVVPEGFTVTADHGWVNVRHGDDDPGTSTGVGAIVRSHEDWSEGAASAASAFLNSVQDYISEEIHEPWPRMPAGPRVPAPEVEVVGSTLQMWFGDRTSPTLAVSDIDLSQLQ